VMHADVTKLATKKFDGLARRLRDCDESKQAACDAVRPAGRADETKGVPTPSL